MNPAAETLRAARLLEIRCLHVAAGDGRASDYSSVLCPRRRESMPLETCLRCDDSGGIAQDPAARTAYVTCRGVADGSAAARAAPSGPTLADRTPVSAIMSTRVVAVRRDVAVAALTELFLDRGIGGVPVVDAVGRPIGVVSKTDVLREHHDRCDTVEMPPLRAGRGYRVELGPGYHAEPTVRTVGDVMTRVAFTVSEQASVAQAAALMAFEGIHRVPVVAADGRVAGVVTTLDILRWLAQQDGYLLPSDASLVAR